MFCNKCGDKNADGSAFCRSCGSRIADNDKTQRIRLKCKECGGVMTADGSNKTLHCPYCGSSEVVIYGDAVEVERIRADTYKEIEYKKMGKRRRKRTRIGKEKSR